jgi:hypothetical protein
VGVEGDAVDDGSDEARVGEHGSPFAERQVRADGDGGSFFSFGDDLEEQFGAARVELDGEVAAFRSRSLAHTGFPYLFLDATYLKARVDGRVVSRAVVIATGVTADGGREVLGWTSATARMAPSGRRSSAA